jgi:hypothetical protein
MEQRVKKARLFRTLKVVYYCLGLPVFLLAVFTLTMHNIGHNPFMGDYGEGLFTSIKSLLSAPAMYAIWIALAVWLIIGLVQLICKFAIKNRRTRAMVVVAIMLDVLLVPMFAIDAIYTSKIDAMIADAADGVVIKDYNYHLSYYRTHTSAAGNNGLSMKTSLTDTLKDTVEQYLRVYNIPMYGSFKGGNAANFTNEALYYDDFGYDYNADGVVDSYDHILIRNEAVGEPGAFDKVWATELVLTDMFGDNETVVEGNFYSVHYTQAVSPNPDENVECYVWYDGNKLVYEKSEGVYGEAYYNKNGTLADGYIYSLDVALRILEDYYQSQEDMKALFKATGKTNEAAFRAEIEAAAETRREERYTGADATEEEIFLWERENAMAADYSLTAAELNRVLGELGGALADSSLLKQVAPLLGMLLPSLLGGPLNIETILGMVLGSMPETINFLKAQLNPDLLAIELKIKWNTTGGHDNLAIDVIKPGASPVTINLDDNFSVATVKQLISSLGISNKVLAEIITMIGLEAKADNDTVEGLEAMITGLLENLYWYVSPVLAPTYDFYVDETLDPEDDTDAAIMAYQEAYAKYKRAEYEGGLHGYLCGSRLLGGALGSGNYAESHGLQNLTAVKQLQTDLEYQPTLYSLLIVRDMLMTFAAFILFFTMMSYIAADREILWATGKIDPNKGKKAKKSKKAGNAEENNEEVA